MKPIDQTPPPASPAPAITPSSLRALAAHPLVQNPAIRQALNRASEAIDAARLEQRRCELHLDAALRAQIKYERERDDAQASVLEIGAAYEAAERERDAAVGALRELVERVNKTAVIGSRITGKAALLAALARAAELLELEVK